MVWTVEDIATLDELLTYRALGATRIGCSKTREILEECKRRALVDEWHSDS